METSSDLLSILIPVIVTPLCGIVSWIVRGYIEKNSTAKKQQIEEIRRYLIQGISYEISNFYWPLYINLVRYKKLTEKYIHIKSGTLATSTASTESTESTSVNVEQENILLESLEKISSHSSSEQSTKSQLNDTCVINIDSPGKSYDSDHLNINILENFTSFLHLYEKNILELLLKIQTIYTQHATHASFNDALFEAIIKLDEYITYVTTAQNEILSVSFMNRHLNGLDFPDSIYIIVEKTLHELQSKHNDLLYNKFPYSCNDMNTHIKRKSIFGSILTHIN